MDIQSVVKKVEELKAVILLAQRVFPFIEELFKFVGDTTPLLEEVNRAIQENLDKMPNASKQLAKVTEATETATTEIMDTVDRITNELFSIVDALEELKKIDEQRLENPIVMLQTIADGIADGKDLKPLLPEIISFIDRVSNATSNEHIDTISGIITKLSDIANEANTIIMALQIQDITAQQLAAVNHLLKNIQARLSQITLHFNPPTNADFTKDIQFIDDKTKVSLLHRNVAFDPDAIESIGRRETRQGEVDNFVENFSSSSLDTATEDTYAYASRNTKIEEPAVESDISAAFSGNDNVEEFSQDDIDALFGGAK